MNDGSEEACDEGWLREVGRQVMRVEWRMEGEKGREGWIKKWERN